MPNSWRILLGLSILSIRDNILVNPRILLYFYKLQENSDEKYRFQLNARTKRKLLRDTSTCDKGWQNRYFFVRGDWGQSTPGQPPQTIRNSWNLNFDRNRSEEPRNLSEEERVATVQLQTVPDLSLKTLLAKQNFEYTGLHIPRGIPLPQSASSEISVTYLDWLKYCIQVCCGATPDAWTHLWPNLSEDQLKAMENKSIVIARPSASQARRNARKADKKISERKAKNKSKAAEQELKRKTPPSPIPERMVILSEKGKEPMVDPTTIDLTVSENLPSAKRARASSPSPPPPGSFRLIFENMTFREKQNCINLLMESVSPLDGSAFSNFSASNLSEEAAFLGFMVTF